MDEVFDYNAARKRLNVFRAINAERLRQEQLRMEGRFKSTCAGHSLTDPEKAIILGEECGEVCGAIVQDERLANDRTQSDVRKEILHVAAVAVAWLESFERD
jgi:hypothetical protein